MHDVNPMGPLRHLEELERRAVSRLRAARAKPARQARLWPLILVLVTRMRAAIARKMPAG
ncbi:hypothetical protein [Taklimakanibacter albus]|uniref:Uncharacterized protein n=1 Tax=Taklimakanibacter albus TaxID=2800327 RepID=A0ACC5RCE8_9HYPH|nr:hypothetical protein [Aestuariivirga sp. YIM B02566]MBK1870313.1 hypothetical protein [Aestuariivirga sp. YIM B02566]